jgi:hypothetical protein
METKKDSEELPLVKLEAAHSCMSEILMVRKKRGTISLDEGQLLLALYV